MNNTKRIIEAEVRVQLAQMKRQIDAERAADMRQIRAELRQYMDKKSNDTATSNAQLARTGSSSSNESLSLAVQQVSNRVSDQVYSRVVNDINRKILPQINSALDWIDTQIVDGDELVTEYRREVDAETGPIGNNMLCGPADSRTISPHVRLFIGKNGQA